MIITLPNKSAILAPQIVAILEISKPYNDNKYVLQVAITNGSVIDLMSAAYLSDIELVRDALLIQWTSYIKEQTQTQ